MTQKWVRHRGVQPAAGRAVVTLSLKKLWLAVRLVEPIEIRPDELRVSIGWRLSEARSRVGAPCQSGHLAARVHGSFQQGS
jgi:hypothetical protein